MTLEQLRQQNSLRTADINALLDELHTKLEQVVAEHENASIALKTAQEELPPIETETKELTGKLATLKENHADEILKHTNEVTELEKQCERLDKLNKDATEEYQKLVNDKQTVLNDIAVEKNELKVREISLKAKIEGFRKEKEEFNFEKRKFEGDKSDYADIL